MVNLGILYCDELKDFEKAIATYQLAIEKGDARAMVGLGNLYRNNLKDFDKAIAAYQLAIDIGDTDAMNALAWLFFEQNWMERLGEATALANKGILIQDNLECLDTLTNVLLWGKEFKEADLILRQLLQHNNYHSILSEITSTFIFLLARKQFHSAYKLFQDFPDLQEEIKPVYYAVMTLLKDEYPKEYLKMGEELETTVAEILLAIDKMREKYS